jgi:hypothetical protein
VEEYNSIPDTYAHIAVVQANLQTVAILLMNRAQNHDRSKLEDPELAIFNEFTPKLKNSTYGSDEYKKFLSEMGAGLEHHYKFNDHHPEHFEEGIHGMDLIQLIEMLCDWQAATLRHSDGDLAQSIETNSSRFEFGYEIHNLLTRTARNLGWIKDE